MKLTVKQALEMLSAMGQLDSYQNGADKLTLYKYGGDTRLRIAIARRKLRAIQEDYTEARNAALMEATDGVGSLPSMLEVDDPIRHKLLAAQHMAFAKKDGDLLKAMVEIDVKPLAVEAFKLEENPIPATVLDLLGDFIEIGE